MKIRWREHEFILATVVTATVIAFYLRDGLNLTPEEMGSRYATLFSENNLPFNFYLNILFPQVAQVLLLYLGYLAVIGLIIPTAKKLALDELPMTLFRKIGWIAFKVIVVSYSLALGVNSISFYAHPHFYNYGLAGFDILALFGYNDQPLKNLFTGFDRAFNMVAMVTAWACMREIIICHVETAGSGRAYRVLVTNQITTILCVYFSLSPLILDFAKPNLPGLLIIYFSLIPPTLLVFMSNTYWLFPLKGEMSVFSPRILLRLLLSTLIFIIPFVLGHSKIKEYFIVYWIFQLSMITPFSWLFYRQRKDKILQLRGVEQQLMRSNADLQFLRSQINPHFLFNALNTIYGTALQEKSDRTAEGIQKLGDMMRFMLHQNNLDFIPLRNEIEYLKNYISLQKLRIQSSSDITIDEKIDDGHCDHDIAPMLLIPLVENAFKHGISLAEKSWIKINLNCDREHIYFEIRNSIHSRQQHIDPEREQSGIGLPNVKERLKLMYGDRHQFHYAAVGNEFTALLTILTTNSRHA
jgi:hypothetical protein